MRGVGKRDCRAAETPSASAQSRIARPRFASPSSRSHSPQPSTLSARPSHGFTLIEILVVVVIVGVLAVALTLAVAGNAERQLADEAERFRALLAHACGQAELSGREIGAVLDANGYAFRRLDGSEWRELAEGELRARRWPNALRLALERGGRPLELATPERPAPQLVCFSSGELTPFVLTLSLGDAPQRYRVVGNDSGSVKVER